VSRQAMIAPYPTAPLDRLRRNARRVMTLLCAAVLAALAVATAAGATAATQFSLAGRGWGHGIGMSQYGAYGYAKNTTLTYKQILQRYYTGIDFTTVPNRTVRVRLTHDISSVSVSSAAAFTVTDGTTSATIPANAVAKVTWVGGKSHVAWGTTSGTSADLGATITFSPTTTYLRLVNKTELGYANVQFRGKFTVIHASTGFTVVNAVPLEYYLAGVVPRESPSSWPLTALKVQAVAARSYAMATLKTGGLFDLYTTTASQVYNGVGPVGGGPGETAATNKAVNETHGEVATYGGKVITAYFFSTSGGHTESIENVWQSSPPVGYLKGVTDPYDSISPLHFWPDNPIVRAGNVVRNQLNAYSTGLVKGSLKAVYVVKHGTSPRVVRALVIGTSGYGFVEGADLRSALALRDTWVSFTSLSLSPSAVDKPTINYGSAITLTGDLYPGQATGTLVILHYYRDGVWRTVNVKTTRVLTMYGSTAVYSSHYSYTVKPPKGTIYYFTYGSAATPRTTVPVRPLVKLSASTRVVPAGGKITFSGMVTPALTGRTIQLQIRTGTAWATAGSAVVGTGGAYKLLWVAKAGATAARMYLPSGAGYVGVYSNSLALTVQ
jgi:stage II sporulation protein D